MRKLKWIAALLLASAMVLVGCNNGNSDGNDTPSGGGNADEPGTGTKICLTGADANTTWNIWAWKKAASGDSNYDTQGWPGGTFQLTKKNADKGYVYGYMELDKTVDLGILFVASSGSPQTADIIVPKDVIASNKELYFVYGMAKYYTSLDEISGIQSAEIASADGNTVNATVLGVTEVKATDFTVKDKGGNAITVSSATIANTTVTIKLAGGNTDKAPYTVTYKGKGVPATVTPSLAADIIDEKYVYDGNDLGLTLNGAKATFKSWSPLASKVSLILYKDASLKDADAKSVEMKLGDKGVWAASDVDVTGYKYYQYEITNGSNTYKVSDIWHNVAGVDSKASQIININDASLTSGWDSAISNPWTGTDYSEAVIYEMHIRDWSMAFNKDSTGSFDEITAALAQPNGELYKHLTDLGVTHVQILPMFDYAQTNADKKYNWGYNPYHYNVPEGRYVKNMKEGGDAVKAMRAMIKAFHDAGIAVNMDVVYNHTSGTGANSLYDMTIPQYFYRMNADGSYSNGSGCGNETATNHKMVKKYVIDSLKHWVTNYNIDGFRFDLMGVHEKETMKEIYDELAKIKSNVMVYGEPWDAGGCAVKDGSQGAVAGTSGMGAGCFDDDFRDALIRAGMSNATDKGHLQGNYTDANLNLGLTGALIANNKRNETGLPGLALHYVECHDNYTLFDKLIYSNFDGYSDATKFPATITDEQIAKVRPQQKLAAAYIFLSQGTPFINGGQEFMRTKKGNPDSYAADTKGGKAWSEAELLECNRVDLSFKETYSDVYNVYKGLIALRKANKAAFSSNTSAKAETVSAGVTKYTTGDFLVYFNATDAEVAITTTGYSKAVDVTSGTPTEGTTLPTKVDAKGFVILKK